MKLNQNNSWYLTMGKSWVMATVKWKNVWVVEPQWRSFSKMLNLNATIFPVLLSFLLVMNWVIVLFVYTKKIKVWMTGRFADQTNCRLKGMIGIDYRGRLNGRSRKMSGAPLRHFSLWDYKQSTVIEPIAQFERENSW